MPIMPTCQGCLVAVLEHSRRRPDRCFIENVWLFIFNNVVWECLYIVQHTALIVGESKDEQ